MTEWVGMPHFKGLETEPCFGDWSVAMVPGAFVLDRTIHAAGWNFFYMAPEVKALYLGFPGEKKLRGALKRILAKVALQHFNGLEITGIAARRFLGVPYVMVSAHSRHVQQSCSLDSPEARLTSQNVAEWARG